MDTTEEFREGFGKLTSEIHDLVTKETHKELHDHAEQYSVSLHRL